MADLSAFATKEKAEEGVILPVKIKGTKVPLAIKLYGSDADVVIEHDKEKLRKLGLGRKGKKDLDEDDLEELFESQDEDYIVKIGGVYSYDWKKKKVVDEPIVLFGREITNDEDSYRFLIENMPALKGWIKEQSDDRDNFLGERKKN